MRVEVDVKRAEEHWDCDTGQYHNYLVIEFGGVEIHMPCTPEQLAAAVRETRMRGVATVEQDAEELEVDESQPVEAPSTFVQQAAQHSQQLGGAPEGAGPEPRTRKLAPLKRERGDDVGIAQG